MVIAAAEVEEVVERIRLWPIADRLVLAQKVLLSAGLDVSASVMSRRGVTSQSLVGLWNPREIAPTDDECDQILAEELFRKHIT